MVLWGGLRPIAVQVVVDIIGLTCFGYATCTKVNDDNNNNNKYKNGIVLIGGSIFTVLLSGNLTNRWTIIFPMMPFLVLQSLRRFLPNNTNSNNKNNNNDDGDEDDNNNNYTRNNKLARVGGWIIGILSFILIFMAAALSVLFPAVELPVPDESFIYNVGVVDLFLPKIEWDYNNNKNRDLLEGVPPFVFDPSQHQNDHLAIRILYPTLDEPGTIPYLRPNLSEAFCEVSMKYGAPPPLQSFDWIVHNWRLAQLPAREYAQPLHIIVTDDDDDDGEDNDTTDTKSSSSSKLPIIIYSPGLGGSSEMYSYQTFALAAHGYVVVVVEHGDGSLAVVPRKDGSVFKRNDDQIIKDFFDGNLERHNLARRAMTEYRTEEFLAATEHVIDLNRHNLPELEAAGVSFVGKLDTTEIHFMGHSFGGATSLHAARKTGKRGRRRTIRPTSIISHEPASEWIPDPTRGSLFDSQRLKGSDTNYTYWTSDVTDEHHATSVHDFDMLVLFSHEWEQKQWGGIEVLQDMQQRGQFGRNNNYNDNHNNDQQQEGGQQGDGMTISRVEVVDSAHHIEFSDMSMLTPTWLARGVGMTGEKNPLESAKDIHLRTLNFLKEVRGQPSMG